MSCEFWQKQQRFFSFADIYSVLQKISVCLTVVLHQQKGFRKDCANSTICIFHIWNLTLKAPNKNCSRWHFNFLLLSFEENKPWCFKWIFCLAEDSLETSSLISSEKQWKNIYKCRLLQSWFGALRVKVLKLACRKKYKQSYPNLYFHFSRYSPLTSETTVPFLASRCRRSAASASLRASLASRSVTWCYRKTRGVVQEYELWVHHHAFQLFLQRKTTSDWLFVSLDEEVFQNRAYS